jgi:hypothetical protein
MPTAKSIGGAGSHQRTRLSRLFPVLRENTGKFAEFSPKTTIDGGLRDLNSITYNPNSLNADQGSAASKTGNAERLSRERLLQVQAAKGELN